MTAFRLAAPAEADPHARTWMCWPATPAIYGDDTGYFESVQETLGRLAATIAKHEPVSLCAAAEHHPLARRLCGPAVELVDIATDDMWARDCGPVFVRDPSGRLAALDLNFNGWGGKERHALDSRVPAAIARHLGLPRLSTPLCGEGGGLEWDGDGTLIVNASCWVNANRNPDLDRDAVAAELKAKLGVETIVWLPGVIGEDITDGHIDGAVRFVRPGLLALDANDEEDSVWTDALDEARAILARATDARGRPFELVDLQGTTDVRSDDPDYYGDYVNFYVGNGAVYAPAHGDARRDSAAAETLARLFPDRRVVTLDVRRIYENGGGIHCVTQQQPAASRPATSYDMAGPRGGITP